MLKCKRRTWLSVICLLSAMLLAAALCSCQTAAGGEHAGSEDTAGQGTSSVSMSAAVSSETTTRQVTTTWAGAVWSADLRFTLAEDGHSYIVSGTDGTSEQVYIPHIYYGKEGNYAVVAVGREAYAGNTTMRLLVIDYNIKRIEEGAFRDCTSLSQLGFDSNSVLCDIGKDAFRGCTRLESVRLPDTVTVIGEGAFRDCSSLTQITIPQGVEEIGGYAFEGTGELTVTYKGTIARWHAIGGDAPRRSTSYTVICTDGETIGR